MLQRWHFLLKEGIGFTFFFNRARLRRLTARAYTLLYIEGVGNAARGDMRTGSDTEAQGPYI